MFLLAWRIFKIANTSLDVIQKVFNIASTVDKMQILDIILAGSDQNSFEQQTANYTEADWKNTLRSFYGTFQDARLASLKLKELVPNMNYQALVDARKDISRYKKAPEYYYAMEAAREFGQIKPADPKMEYRQQVLDSLYAAVSQGENYASVSYPPQAFIDNVAKVDMTPDEYHATVTELMKDANSFESLILSEGKAVPGMIDAYKVLVGLADPRREVVTGRERGAVASRRPVTRRRDKGADVLNALDAAAHTNPQTALVADAYKVNVKARRFVNNVDVVNTRPVQGRLSKALKILIYVLFALMCMLGILHILLSAKAVSAASVNLPMWQKILILPAIAQSYQLAIYWAKAAIIFIGAFSAFPVLKAIRTGHWKIISIVFALLFVIGSLYSLLFLVQVIAALFKVSPLSLQSIAEVVLG